MIFEKDLALDNLTRVTRMQEMRCKNHITLPKEKLPYLEWHTRAEASSRRGGIQKRCEECGLWFFPWEMKKARRSGC
jgi:hypothetical protein